MCLLKTIPSARNIIPHFVSCISPNCPLSIEPNEARVAVPDDRFEWLVSHWKPASSVSAYLTVLIDLFGLEYFVNLHRITDYGHCRFGTRCLNWRRLGQRIPVSHSGSGWNLSRHKWVNVNRIRIYLPSGVFEDDDITHVEGAIDPLRDMEIISEELRLKVNLFIFLFSQFFSGCGNRWKTSWRVNTAT